MTNPKHHVIVGNGAAGIAAAEALRAVDRRCQISMLSAEPGPAYSKVLLHYYVAGGIDESTLAIRGLDFYEGLQAELIHGEVEGLDVAAQRVHLADGRSIPYDTLLLATGASAFRPPIPGIALPNVHCLWTLEDGRALKALAERCRTAAVIGSGFVGIQAADALELRGVHVTLIDVVDRVLPLMLDAQGASMVRDHLLQKGVALRLGVTVTSIAETPDGRKRVDMSDGTSLVADLVVVATGARPNVGFLKGSPVQVERGIVVDERMQTSVPGIYAAGDAVISRDLVTGQPVNCAIWPVAVDQGKVAGGNMAGRPLRHQGSLRLNVTNAMGLIVGSVGLTTEEGDVRSEATSDAGRPLYRRLFYRGNSLVGGMLVGETSDLGILSALIQRRADVSAWRDRLQEQRITYSHVFAAVGPMDRHPFVAPGR